MSVGAYWFVERVENRFGDRDTLPGGSKRVKRAAAAILILLGLVLAIFNPSCLPDTVATMEVVGQ